MVRLSKRHESHEAGMSSFDATSVHALNTVTGTSNERVPGPIVVNVPHTRPVTAPSHTVDYVSSEPPQQTRDSVAIDQSKTTGGTSSDYTMHI
jgi:hypothetical protein